MKKVLVIKELLISAIVILFFHGCTSKIEIPINHAGVAKNDEKVNAEVLKPGEHYVNFDTEVIVYDVSPASFDIEFDFLFSDASEGNIKVEVEFNPIADSLSAFYRKYQSIYVTPIIEQGTLKVARDLLIKYRPTDLTKDEFEIEILKAIKVNHAIINYVEIKEVNVNDLRY
jgi:hypothetical protein